MQRTADLMHDSCQSSKAFSRSWSLEALKLAAEQGSNRRIRTRSLCIPSLEHHLVQTAHMEPRVAGGP